jgi:DNA-binding XRE family transcriptional regulator
VISLLVSAFVTPCYNLHMNRGRPRIRRGRRTRLGERLRYVRAELRLNQDRAADAIGVSRVTLARWETGSHQPRGLALRFVEQWIDTALGVEVNRGK